MNELKPARLISDKMIMQRDKKGHIWGFDNPGTEITVVFDKEAIKSEIADSKVRYKAITGSDGRFDVFTDELTAGGPFEMTISDDIGNKEVISDIYVGDVFVMCGQSNMEFPMYRVFDTYPEAAKEPGDDSLRTFKIVENRDYVAPVIDNLTGSWEEPNPQNIRTYPAIGYFFGKELSRLSGCKVGMINASLGGSPIASWMSAKMLEGMDDLLAITKRYTDKEYYESVLKHNEEVNTSWYKAVDAIDKGLINKYSELNADPFDNTVSDWKTIDLPKFFDECELKGFVGSLWLSKKFTVSKEMLDKRARVWFGTLFDADTMYINGTFVGSIGYCYPPRRYEIPEGVLKEGENVITIRLCVEGGRGRFTPGKKYGIVFGEVKRHVEEGFYECLEGHEGFIDLAGEWKYEIGATYDKKGPTDFLSWKPTALYNGMLAPTVNYPIKGFIWYQGESDTHTFEKYKELSRRQIEGIRELWNDEHLPYMYVRLPRFDAPRYEGDYSSDGNGWNNMRKIQEELLEIPDTYMVDAFETGELNDLHPQQKEPIGRMLAKIANML